jgi:PLP dependent protein
MGTLAENAARVRERVERALARAGRASGSVTVVAVTKTFGVEVVRAAIDAGFPDVGENRVQELLAKAAALETPCRWHLIGPLQRNKASRVVGLVHMIQAIDGVRIAQAVDRLAGERGTRVPVLLEVNVSREASKHGVAPEEVAASVEAIAGCANLDLRGLMTIGPLAADAADTRACFRALATLAEQLRARAGLPLPELSMGMSDDFETAIEEGATIVRLGRVLLGERHTPA